MSRAPVQAPAPASRARSLAVRVWAAVRTPVGAVAAVALAHGLLWSILIPPFQAPDETDHFAYSQYLAENARLPPVAGRSAYSSEERAAFAAIGTTSIIGRPLDQPPHTAAAATAAERALEESAKLSRADGGGPSSATSQPPLSYALAAVPYYLGSGGTILTRLWLMRLLSVLCFVATAVGAALLARELLPTWPWAPLAAGLLVALQPVLAFASAVVNPDALLFTASTWALLVAVRIVRRGLTLRRALWLGTWTGVGLMTKVTFAGLVPGLALALAIGVYRLSRSQPRRELVRLAGSAIAAAAVLPLAYVIWTTLQGRGLFPTGGGVPLLPADRQPQASVRVLLSYTWQLYLPRLPFLQDQFGYWPPYSTWLAGFVGRLGWLDYGVRHWMYQAAAALFCVSLGLLIVALVRARDRVWARRSEVGMFAVCAIGLALEVAYAGYDYRRSTGQVFEQARYLFPLVALYASGVVVACTAFGRRLAPALAAGYVGIASLHVLAVVFATIARYYA